jgi:hypothetical protein
VGLDLRQCYRNGAAYPDQMDPTSRGVLIALVSIISVCGAGLLWARHTSAASMDFVERYLGFSPDNGDGSLELIFLTVFLMIFTAATFRWAFK